MAIIPETQYPGKITPASTDYPYGQARNITLPGDGTGTPWEAALVNDLFGFQQALLGEAGVVPTGDPETATASQYLQALRRINITPVASMAGMADVSVGGDFEKSRLLAGQNFVLMSFHPDGGLGHGKYEWDPDRPVADHDGGSVRSATVPWDGTSGTLLDFLAGVGETDGGGAGCFVLKETAAFSVASFGGSPLNTKAINRSCLQATIDALEVLGGGTCAVPYEVDYGLINSDATTQPDFTGLVNDIVVIDDSKADADPAANKAGAQRRVFYYTAQTTPPGSHNGNGARIFGSWHPYHWVENNAQYAAQGQPSRTADDNRRASVFFANDGTATWRVGQGTLIGDLTDEEMSNFVIEAFGTTEGNYVPMLVERKTGNISFGGGTNVPSASFHFKSVSTGVANFLVESLSAVTTVNIRNSNGSGEDVNVRNNAGDLELFIPGVGAGLTIDGINRTAKLSNVMGLNIQTKASLPLAANFEGYMTYVSDAAGGASPSFSDGTNWISLLTGAAV